MRDYRNKISSLLTARAIILIFIFAFCSVPSVFAGITIEPVTWNVIGLDSNDTSIGPNLFPVGARVCNTGGAAVNNVSASFIWDSANTYINLSARASSTFTQPALAAGVCIDFYFDVEVTRTSLAYNAARRFHITANGDGVSAVSTPTPRELYVEKLISQNRNSDISITGPTTVYVGQTYQYTVVADTAPQGYEQLEAFLDFSNVIFRVLSVTTTYSTGGTIDKVYADGCRWDNVPTSPTYRSCLGAGKNGGRINTVYTVRVMSSGTMTSRTLVRDFSGSSYHYNSDFRQKDISITALPTQPTVNLTKSVTPSGTQPSGTELTYTINFTSTGNVSARNFQLIDPNPGGALRINTNTDFKVGSVTNSLGTTGLTTVIGYSNDGGVTYAYTPVSGAGGAPAGFDRNVTHIRWMFAGSFSPVAPNNAGSVSFGVKIR
jgi:hypothetical protein